MKKIITQTILMKTCSVMICEVITRRKLIFIESSSFYFLNFYLPTKKRFLQKLALSDTRKVKFVNFKTCFTQFCRKITGYADMLMMYINLPVHGHIKFTKEAVLMPPWLAKKSKNKYLMTNENKKATNHNKIFCFSFKVGKQIFN